jgi:predicted glycosyltransferase
VNHGRLPELQTATPGSIILEAIQMEECLPGITIIPEAPGAKRAIIRFQRLRLLGIAALTLEAEVPAAQEAQAVADHPAAETKY